MSKYKLKSQKIFIRGKQVAVLRNLGQLCDIRRRANGFLYSGGMRVALSTELLDQLADTTVLQITDMDRRDVYSCTVSDFRRWGEIVQYSGFEKQLAVEVSRMNLTSRSRKRKARKNEPLQIEAAPLPQWQQTSMV